MTMTNINSVSFGPSTRGLPFTIEVEETPGGRTLIAEAKGSHSGDDWDIVIVSASAWADTVETEVKSLEAILALTGLNIETLTGHTQLCLDAKLEDWDDCAADAQYEVGRRW